MHYSPLTKDTWADLEKLFGAKGACGGCWCMYWRLTSRKYEISKGAGNKQKLKDGTAAGQPLGVIAYQDTEPVGWCSVSPRETLVRLENSRLLSRIDDQAVWSITCLFIKKEYRRQGLSPDLIRAAAQYAFAQGTGMVEAYPMITRQKNMPAVFAWVGFAESFKKAGFEVVAQRSETRLIMRLMHIPNKI